MPNRKPKKHIGEVHPNPHGEQDVMEMPLETDQRHITRENVAQTTSTVKNRLNPSVGGAVADAKTSHGGHEPATLSTGKRNKDRKTA